MRFSSNSTWEQIDFYHSLLPSQEGIAERALYKTQLFPLSIHSLRLFAAKNAELLVLYKQSLLGLSELHRIHDLINGWMKADLVNCLVDS